MGGLGEQLTLEASPRRLPPAPPHPPANTSLLRCEEREKAGCIGKPYCLPQTLHSAIHLSPWPLVRLRLIAGNVLAQLQPPGQPYPGVQWHTWAPHPSEAVRLVAPLPVGLVALLVVPSPVRRVVSRPELLGQDEVQVSGQTEHGCSRRRFRCYRGRGFVGHSGRPARPLVQQLGWDRHHNCAAYLLPPNWL